MSDRSYIICDTRRYPVFLDKLLASSSPIAAKSLTRIIYLAYYVAVQVQLK